MLVGGSETRSLGRLCATQDAPGSRSARPSDGPQSSTDSRSVFTMLVHEEHASLDPVHLVLGVLLLCAHVYGDALDLTEVITRNN